MLKKTITYTDFNGNPRTDDLYFNLSAPELMKLEMTFPKGLQKELERIQRESDSSALFDLFEKVIMSSYGVKSDDGRSFVKNEAVMEEFKESAAYPALFAELAFEEGALDAFINGIIPTELLAKLKARKVAQ
jgi:hypothetical protein